MGTIVLPTTHVFLFVKSVFLIVTYLVTHLLLILFPGSTWKNIHLPKTSAQREEKKGRNKGKEGGSTDSISHA